MAVYKDTFTAESVLKSLGYADPMVAAKQQALMLLLGRKAHYEAEIQQIQARHHLSFEQMQEQYSLEGTERFDVDDDFVQWKWFADALNLVEQQIAALQIG